MKRFSKFLAAFLVLGMTCTMCKIQGTAAKERTYRITLYAGNHGIFTDASFISIAGDKTEGAIDIEEGGSVIKVSGLKKGEIVILDAAAEGAVNMEGNSKYYIKGIRRGGRDNSEADTSAVLADADRDYVIAYAVRGDMVSYEVRYEDKAGRALAQSRIYHGNVGDRPVAAFIYIPGYVPQAYNLTKTLSQNASENVFTFVYSRLSSSGQESGSSQETDKGSENTGEISWGTEENAEATAVQEVQRAETSDPAGAEITSLIPETKSTPADQEEELASIPDTDTPREIIGLDDEDIKLWDTAFFENLMVAVLAVLALSIVCLLLWLRKNGLKKKENERS